MNPHSSTNRVMNQLDSLSQTINHMQQNAARQTPNHQTSPPSGKDLYSEFAELKSSMGVMIDLVVQEIDGIKKELYLDFAQNQKAIFNDLEVLKKRVEYQDHNIRVREHEQHTSQQQQKDQARAIGEMIEQLHAQIETLHNRAASDKRYC